LVVRVVLVGVPVTSNGAVAMTAPEQASASSVGPTAAPAGTVTPNSPAYHSGADANVWIGVSERTAAG
jgi:hypothetical protein